MQSHKDKVLEVTKEVKDLIGASDTALAISKADYVNMMEMFTSTRPSHRENLSMLSSHWEEGLLSVDQGRGGGGWTTPR